MGDVEVEGVREGEGMRLRVRVEGGDDVEGERGGGEEGVENGRGGGREVADEVDGEGDWD